MNENLNLCEILKDCPKGTKLWSPFLGEVELSSCDNTNSLVTVYRIYSKFIFYSDGTYDRNGECMLFPSKEQRDWSKFKVPVERFNPEEFQPFDKILVRDGNGLVWTPSLFDRILKEPTDEGSVVELIGEKIWKMCIPYNNKTKHLLRTTNDCLEYYKWWEK